MLATKEIHYIEMLRFQLSNIWAAFLTFYLRIVDKQWCVDQAVENLPAVQETGIWSLGVEDPQEKVKVLASQSCLTRQHCGL